MATTLRGVHGRNVQLLVVVEYSNEWEHALIHHLQMEERTAQHWDLQWRQRIVTHSLAQVSIQGSLCSETNYIYREPNALNLENRGYPDYDILWKKQDFQVIQDEK